jgi:FtsP/CotA-like multicopper oxidase with cupredoxin domain
MYPLSIVFKRTNLIVLFFLACALNANASINGVTGTPTGSNAVTFDLIASSANIPTPDGNSIRMWGYGVAGSPMQYPGPTMIVNQGDVVTVKLTNTDIPMPVSILFPGQKSITATGGSQGQFTRESAMGGNTVTYTFTASNAGTYTYYSGTKPGLQVEMGLMGALIVRSDTAGQAYNDTDAASQYDREYLYILSSIDPVVHQDVEFGLWADVDNTVSHSTLWFINGRLAPDTLFPDGAAFLPNQPYGSLAQMHPGENVLVRVIGGGREAHPFHFHGNNITIFARDGRLLSSTGAAADLSYSDYTLQVLPGATYDAIWTWTGDKLGFDIYGGANAVIETPTLAHTCDGSSTHTGTSADYDSISHEYCPDHGKDIPVILPEGQELTYGGFYSGSPFLGALADLPPGEGGLNAAGGLFFMWHSHNEKELTNDDIFPGGMLTQMIVQKHDVVIEPSNP